MSVHLLPAPEMSELRCSLDELGYTQAGLEAAFDTATPPRRASLPQFLHATRHAEALPALARSLLAGFAIPTELATRVWPPRLLELCVSAGLLRRDPHSLVPQATVVPVRGLLFASDPLSLLDSDEAATFVMPASTHAAGYLLDLTMREPVEETFDLGTGCGVQALLAAAHSKRVLASDLNPRATRYAEFNARLNGLDNVACVTGDLFAPAAGRAFDLIVANPPFVPAPSQTFVYRDTGMELDGLCRRLIREAPAFLREGGFLQMLCEWVEVEGEPWQERLRAWTEGLGCDCWVLRSPPQKPVAYAALRLAEVVGPRSTVPVEQQYADWLDYFAQHRVTAIHPGAIVLRRRRGRNWFHVQPLAREIRAGAGEAIRQNFASCDFLAARERADQLLDVILKPSPELRLEQSHSRAGGSWRVEGFRLWLAGGLPFDAEIDAASAALLREFDGISSTRDCLQRFADLVGDDPNAARRRCLPIVRYFIERGFLLPP